MKIGIMQPYFIPYIGYWQLIHSVDKYVIYNDVQYIKGGWINRNRILVGGEPKFINLFMNGASPNKLINEINVPDNIVQKSKTLKTIKHSYSKAPYFNLIYPVIEKIIFYKEQVLSLYLKHSIETIADYLGINTEFILSSDIEKDNKLKGQDKVLQICKILGATEYYNAIGGKELYSVEVFGKYGIDIKFLKTESIEYKQFDNEFIPNLSIIDVLMFNSSEEVMKMLDLYTLE